MAKNVREAANRLHPGHLHEYSANGSKPTLARTGVSALSMSLSTSPLHSHSYKGTVFGLTAELGVGNVRLAKQDIPFDEA